MTALRDAAMLKFCYAYGLRRREVVYSDVVDLRRNSKMDEFGRFGALSVRYGKASRGGAAKRRTVLTVPEMSWIVEVLDHYLAEVRPQFPADTGQALWLTERGTRIGTRMLNVAFTTVRDEAGIDPTLDLHSLRHSYVTHLVEFDYPERFIQEQVGHSFSSTTAIYVGVSNEYRNRLISQSMQSRYGQHFDRRPR
ncbi:phage integrase family protein [Mycobacterium xenopi 3993]|nr:phage integrase family protein [Mycobacterium xenopi 3993]